jgi:hypothetical protein
MPAGSDKNKNSTNEFLYFETVTSFGIARNFYDDCLTKTVDETSDSDIYKAIESTLGGMTGRGQRKTEGPTAPPVNSTKSGMNSDVEDSPLSSESEREEEEEEVETDDGKG